MADDILTQLQALSGNYSKGANDMRSFADRLRDERLKRAGVVQQFDQATRSSDPYTGNGGVALDPNKVLSARSGFYDTIANFLSPYSPEMELKARATADSYGKDQADILTQIYQLGQKDKELNAKTDGTTVDDLLKRRKELLDQGLDTSEIDNALGLEKTIGKDEIQGVDLINSILGKNISGAAGLIHVKGIRPYETQDVRNQLKQLNAILQLASVGKLKGQGQVSDAERALLSSAVTDLGLDEKGNTGLSDAQVREKLVKIRAALAKKSNDPNYIRQYALEDQNSPKPSGTSGKADPLGIGL